MILRALLRTYFLDLALETAWEKIFWNLVMVPSLKHLPQTEEELIRMVESGEMYSMWGIEGGVGAAKECLELYGFEITMKAVEDIIRGG